MPFTLELILFPSPDTDYTPIHSADAREILTAYLLVCEHGGGSVDLFDCRYDPVTDIVVYPIKNATRSPDNLVGRKILSTSSAYDALRTLGLDDQAICMAINRVRTTQTPSPSQFEIVNLEELELVDG